MKNSNGVVESQNVEKHGVRVSSMELAASNSELPANFGEVVKGIYRSSFPQPWNLPALKGLGLKTIITLVEEPYTQSHEEFLKANGILHHRIVILANKDPAVKTPECVMNRVLEILLNKSNHPILIHCNKGKHRTGCVSACFRKLQGWDMRDVINEYIHYSCPKSRGLDEVFIKEFDPSKLSTLVQISGAKSWHSGDSSKVQNEERTSSNRLIQPPRKGIRVS
ncbi:hypothetical protein AOCH_000800 [Aspergillus ochraceoroseus]|nr:hypothetical protein AOCH_000800 [Aspergillus ochraceoroseus]